MELKEGSLDAQLVQGPLSFEQVRSIVRQVLELLTRLHDDDKVHGAIRPGTIRLDTEGNVQLADPSGIVSVRGMRGAGPAKYLAPELLKAEFGPVGPGVDLYCLGFTALELLKGPDFDSLFPGVGPQDIDVEIAWMRWHRSSSDTLPPAQKLIPSLPADLGAVLDRLVQKNVHDRYASAAEALHDLEQTSASAAQAAWRKGEASTLGEEDTTPTPVADWRPGRRSTMPLPDLDRPHPRGSKAVFFVFSAILLACGITAASWYFWPFASDMIAVRITSSPPHAKLFIDDKPLAEAADTTYALPPGEYNLRVLLEGYEPFESRISVSEKKKFHKPTLTKLLDKAPDKNQIGALNKDSKSGSKDLEAKNDQSDTKAKVVTPKPRMVHIVSSPKGASVYVNEVPQPFKTDGDFVVPAGPIVLKVMHEGAEPVIRKFADASQLDKAIEVVFDRTVTLRTQPPGATLFVDGKEHQGKSPVVVSLKPGKHQVKAMMPGYADEEKTLVVEDDSKLTHEESFTLQPMIAERHALIVGVRAGTKDLPSFVHAEADAETLAKALQIGGFKPDKVALLTQTRGLLRPEEQPTAANIKQRLQGLGAVSSAADIIVVALIGHVVEAPDRAYFCPAGADLPVRETLVSLPNVLDAVAAAPAKKKLLILDCWRKDWKDADKLAHVRAWDMTPPPGVTILFACAKGQTGYEHSTSWHGAFNYYLIQGLLGEAARPEVTVPLLADYCKGQVAKLVDATWRQAEQTPVLVSGQRSEGWALTAPGRPAANYLSGCAQLGRKTYDKTSNDDAIEAFNQAEPDLPGFVELYLRRAEAYYRAKEFDKAKMDCRTALALDANNADAYASLAEIQAAQGDFTSAVKSGARAVDLDPQCALAYDALGSVYISSRDYESALKKFTKAIELQPELYVFYQHRALVHRNNKEWDEAIADFNQAILRNDRIAILFAGRGNAWRYKNDSKRAIDDYSEAIKLDSSDFQWWVTRGTLRIELQDWDKAIADLEKATSLKGDYPLAWFNLGYAYSEKGMYTMAVMALNKALRLDQNYAPAKRLLERIVNKK